MTLMTLIATTTFASPVPVGTVKAPSVVTTPKPAAPVNHTPSTGDIKTSRSGKVVNWAKKHPILTAVGVTGTGLAMAVPIVNNAGDDASLNKAEKSLKDSISRIESEWEKSTDRLSYEFGGNTLDGFY
ncbi:hypothetical protein ROZALSC1DRAFT_28768 [Rozella allomycis CSF55]|uniref:Uncharacterized protein n=1 Tax=Rozella allomycis (strain CSF55) TaxID=988480 RepID=A0A075ANI4_ROZAC|nr:hypothetical protein O9G_003139 [Rozella allomycis CSF55]RKP19652.1 hypothetical protein ROZALSC1DRAFT_28768 [Rozella allomycis CSF55]|eukprot:EPZ31417.1 hypothetical protein O9G_003139 [Rozella allomycis CSF55]